MTEIVPYAVMPVVDTPSAVSRYRQVMDFVREVFTEGVDYGLIPGTQEKTLLKPGAEKICFLFGLSPRFEILDKDEDWTGERHSGEPFFYYLVRCQLCRDGKVVVSAEGSCNSWETRYRWRWVRPDEVPSHLRGAKLMETERVVEEYRFAVERAETTGPYGKPAEYWASIAEAIERGEAQLVTKHDRRGHPQEAWRVATKMVRIPNPDAADLVNTILKQAEKRALVAAALIAGNLSSMFTQDLEDYGYRVPGEVPTTARVVVEQPQEKGEQAPAPKEEKPLPPPMSTKQPAAEWDWNAVFKPFMKWRLSQRQVLDEFGAPTPQALREVMGWAEVMAFVQWCVEGLEREGSLEALRKALGIQEGETLYSVFAKR